MDRARTIPQIAKVEFVSDFSGDELEQTARTPLLLIEPYTLDLPTASHRIRDGNQLMIGTIMIAHNRRGGRSDLATAELLEALNALDAAVVNQDFGLGIQPVDIYKRRAMKAIKGLLAVLTVYRAVVFSKLAGSKFAYTDRSGGFQAIEFDLVATAFQTEAVIDTNDYARSLDGCLRSYVRIPKKKYDVRFTLVSTELKEKLRAMKEAGSHLTFYRDKNSAPTMTCLWTNDFNFFEERPGYWSGSIILAEV